MSWGTDDWGTAPWGIGVSGVLSTVVGVTPGRVAVRGGTMLTVVGTNFTSPATVHVMSGPSNALVVEGTCSLFDAAFDLTASRLFVGAPALAVGTYHIRVTTAAGAGVPLLDALTYRVFAEEVRVHRNRSSWASAWRTGPRWLR